MGIIKCKNCGKEYDSNEYRSKFFCMACGSLIEVKSEINADYDNIIKEEARKAKILLKNSYISRVADEIISSADKVLQLIPDDFFANFLKSYCYFKRNYGLSLVNFFITYNLSGASSEEIEIVLNEITSDTKLFENKCEFIKSLEENGVDISKYLFYFDTLNIQEKENKRNSMKGFTNVINIIATILSLLFSEIIIAILASSFGKSGTELYLTLRTICILFLLIQVFIVWKKGFNKVFFIFSCIFSLLTYPAARFLLTFFIKNTYKERKYDFKEIYFYEVNE